MAPHHIRDDLAANLSTLIGIQLFLREPLKATCSYEIARKVYDGECVTEVWFGVIPVAERLAFEVVRTAVSETSKPIIVGIIVQVVR